METRANYLMVGAFVLTFAVGLLVFVLWLAKVQFDVEYARYDIYFRGSVTGLQQGSAVRYSGVRVGEVIFVGLDREDPGRVRALIEVEANTPIREDTQASLEIEGLTGGRYILLSGGAPDAPPLKTAQGQKRPVIASKASSFEQVLEGAPEMLHSANLLLLKANDLLNAENQANVAATLANLNRLTAALANRGGDIETLISDGASTMANLSQATASLGDMAEALRADGARLAARADGALLAVEQLAGSVKTTVESTETDVKELVVELRGSARAFTDMAGEIRAMVAENRESLRDFTGSGLYDLSTLVTEARDLLVSLNRVTTEVGRDPARFLFGNQQQGYEAPSD